LRKKEILTYVRRNRFPIPSPPIPLLPTQEKDDPPQPIKEVPPPPPPLMHNFILKPMVANEEI
jgi:hypothetical protein